MMNHASGRGCAIRCLLLGILFLMWAPSVEAFHFEKVSENSTRVAPEPQQSEPGGPQTSVGGGMDVEFATFEVTFNQSNDCGTSCETECTTPMMVQCTNLATAIFDIMPDPGEAIGDPVTVCVSLSYEMSVTSSGTHSGYAAVGGVPTVIVDPTLVIRTPGGVQFSHGPVQITAGAQSDQIFRTFGAQVGDMIEARLGTEVKGGGTGVGSFRGIEEAELKVFSCSASQSAPALSKSATVGLILGLTGCGVWAVRRRRARRAAF
jgi:hypothetical protein